MFKKLLMVAGFAAAMVFSTGVAHADTTATFSGSSCPNCPAANYTLTVSGSQGNYTVTLSITFTGAPTAGTDDYINAVAFNLGEGNSLVAGDLTSTSGLSGSLTDWSTSVHQGASNLGCSGGGAGWICSDVNGSGAWTDAHVVNGNTLSWTWTGVDLGGALDTNTADWSIQVKYNNSTGGTNGYLISESPTGVPEPGTLVLLGFGLIPLVVFRRRFFA